LAASFIRHPCRIAHVTDDQPDASLSAKTGLGGSFDAIETFASLLDDIEFGAATAKLGAQSAPHLVLNGVEISVRPEVTLHSKSKTTELVGGIKLHFPKTEPLDEEQADYFTAMMHSFCQNHLWKHGAPYGGHCMVIDLGSGKVYPGVKAVKQRLKEVGNACGQIAARWPGIAK